MAAVDRNEIASTIPSTKQSHPSKAVAAPDPVISATGMATNALECELPNAHPSRNPASSVMMIKQIQRSRPSITIDSVAVNVEVVVSVVICTSVVVVDTVQLAVLVVVVIHEVKA
jgi:hypothetical protein